MVYAFSRPFLLNEQIQISENQSFYKQHILKVIMRVPIMCFFASIFSFIFFQLVSNIVLSFSFFLFFFWSDPLFCPVTSSFSFPVLRALSHRHLPALHLPECEVVSQQSHR